MITEWSSVGREFFDGVDSEEISFEIAATSQAIGQLRADDGFTSTLSQKVRRFERELADRESGHEERH